jgi:hypothetical protein
MTRRVERENLLSVGGAYPQVRRLLCGQPVDLADPGYDTLGRVPACGTWLALRGARPRRGTRPKILGIGRLGRAAAPWGLPRLPRQRGPISPPGRQS